MKKTLIAVVNLVFLLHLAGCGIQTPEQSEETFNDESRKTLISESCQTFFDGCNNCFRTENGEAACTRMMCEIYQAPKCTDDEIQEEMQSESVIPESLAHDYCIEQEGIFKTNTNDDGSSASVCVIDGKEIQEEEYLKQITNTFLNRPLSEVQEEYEARGGSIRIAVQDGEARALTMDYRPDRLNVEVMSGIVVNAFFG